MSKIIPSRSKVAFERINFQDLDSISLEKGSFFLPSLQLSNEQKKKCNNSDKLNESLYTKTSKPQLEQPIDIEAIKEEAYTQGKSAGFLEAEKKLHSTVQAFETGLEQISILRNSLLIKSKEDMIKLIMAAVKQIIHVEVNEKEDIITKTISKVLENAIQADKYYIRVNPKDLSTVNEKEPLFLAAMKGLQNIYFIADETVSRGGCLAESHAGDVDGTIESQLSEIYEHLHREIL